MSSTPSGQARPLQPFHLAFPVTSLENARAFYGDLLGCPEGRSSPEWVDFDFFGHQLVAHLAPNEVSRAGVNAVDGDDVPVRHFGVVLTMDDWHALAERLKAAGTRFIIELPARGAGGGPRAEGTDPTARTPRASTVGSA